MPKCKNGTRLLHDVDDVIAVSRKSYHNRFIVAEMNKILMKSYFKKIKKIFVIFYVRRSVMKRSPCIHRRQELLKSFAIKSFQIQWFKKERVEKKIEITSIQKSTEDEEQPQVQQTS